MPPKITKVLLMNALIVSLSLSIISSASAEEARWNWIHVSVTPGGWEVLQGKAEVSFSNGMLSAKLYDKDYPKFIRFTVSGTVSGNSVDITEIRKHADGNLIKYHGEKRSDTCGSGAECHQIISATDGFNYVALAQ